MDICIEAENNSHPVGIFGRYKSLTLKFNNDLTGSKVYAQDLAGNAATDIINQVTIKRNTLLLPGTVVSRIGLSAASPEDVSVPGMVMVLK